jgi:hypothetical protein
MKMISDKAVKIPIRVIFCTDIFMLPPLCNSVSRGLTDYFYHKLVRCTNDGLSCAPSQFALAVATGDSKAFTKIKGIGTKIAQRIVLELKDKVAKENTISVRGNAAQGFAAVPSGAVEEAVTALVVLGYTEGEAMSVISKLDPNLSVEELIKKALIGLAKF